VRVAAVVLPAFLLLLVPFFFIPRPEGGPLPDLSLHSAFPDSVVAGEATPGRLIIINHGTQPTPRLRLWLGKDFLAHAEIVSLSPPAEDTWQGRTGTFLEYPPLAGGASLQVDIVFRVRKAGVYQVEAEVFGGRRARGAAISSSFEVLP